MMAYLGGMEPRAPERQWSPFTGEQERVEADSDYYDERGLRDTPLDRRTARELKRGRPGLVALIAVIVELIAIGGADNQWVVKHLNRYAAQHPFAFPGHLVNALTVYQWRFAPQPGDRANEPLAHVALVVTVLVLTALLVYVLCRGAVTFWRAFFGTWLAVVVATLAGMVVRNLISPPRYPANFDAAAGALFLGPNGVGVMAGVVLGFVCAVFAAIVAVATRRRVRIDEPAYEPARPEPAPYLPPPRERYPDPSREAETTPYYGQQYGGSGSTTPYVPTPYAAAPTATAAAAAGWAQQPSDRGADAQETTRLPEDTTRSGEDTTRSTEDTTQSPEETSQRPQESDASATTQLSPLPPEERVTPRGADDAAATTQLPTVREDQAPSAEQTEAGEAPTQSFPRPPDDEDLGQHPDHHDFG